MLFDSDVCEWDIGSTEFFDSVFGKEKLVFLVEDNQGNTFGAFIQNKIDLIDDETDEW